MPRHPGPRRFARGRCARDEHARDGGQRLRRPRRNARAVRNDRDVGAVQAGVGQARERRRRVARVGAEVEQHGARVGVAERGADARGHRQPAGGAHRARDAHAARIAQCDPLAARRERRLECGGHGRLRAQQRDHRDSAVVAAGEHRVQPKALDPSRRPAHDHARRGVDLDDPAGLRLPRARDVRDDQVDAGDVELEHARGPLGERAVLGVDAIGHRLVRAAAREVRRGAQPHEFAGPRDRARHVPLLREHPARLVVDLDPAPLRRERVRAADVRAPDQLGDARVPVADDPRRQREHRGHAAAADHEQAHVLAGHVLLHEHRPVNARHRERLAQRRFAREVGEHRDAVVGAHGLDHDRPAGAAGDRERAVDVGRDRARRRRQPRADEQRLGERLARGGDRADVRRRRGEVAPREAALVPVPEQQQRRRRAGDAPHGDAARARRVDDRVRRVAAGVARPGRGCGRRAGLGRRRHVHTTYPMSISAPSVS
ncbi:MAG: hypothetical protein U1E86_17150 [Burkholderiaceae bacterium]